MSKEKIRKVFLDDLPKRGNRIDWENSIQYRVRFLYDDIQGFIKILNYDKENEKLFIEYDNKNYNINTTIFKNCCLGRILNKKTKDFKIEIGQIFKDDKRDLIITDREYRDREDNKGNNKWYKYTCNKCGWTEGWIVEGNLLKDQGCSCCSGKSVVEGINDISTTALWMVKYFQGGYDEAKKYTRSCSKKIYPICPDCGKAKLKPMTINDLYIKKSTGCECGDGISYPEKFMISLLNQLKVKYIYQLSRTTFKWCGNYRYDFYIPKYNIIIEMNGRQHYKETKGFYRTLEQEQGNDKIKRELANNKGIKQYIIIDCRESSMEWIKNNILRSSLDSLLDLSSVNWSKCEEFAINSNKVKEVCEYWNNKEKWETTVDLGRVFNCDWATINSYLIKGENQGWVKNYKEVRDKSRFIKKADIIKRRCSKSVEIFKNGKSLGIFESIAQLVRFSDELFGVKLSSGHISQVCLGKKSQYKGFKFKHTTREEYEEYLKSQEIKKIV